MPGKVPGLKVELRDSKNRKLSTSSRRLSDASRSSIMSPTPHSVKVRRERMTWSLMMMMILLSEWRRIQCEGRRSVGLRG